MYIFLCIFCFIAIFIIININKKDINNFIQLSSNYTNPISNIKIFIINLEKSIDRKQHMLNLMKKLNFTNYEFIKPVSLEICEKEKSKFDNMDIKQLSLKLTNLKIIEHCKNNNLHKFIICEDDIDIFSDNINYLKELLDSIYVYNPDIIYFEFCNCLSLLTKTKKTKKNKKIFYKLKNPSCTAFILYNNISFINNINYYNNLPIDIILRNNILINKINAFGIKIFKQLNNKFKSTLGNLSGSDKYFIF